MDGSSLFPGSSRAGCWGGCGGSAVPCSCFDLWRERGERREVVAAVPGDWERGGAEGRRASAFCACRRAELAALLRKAAERTIETTWKRIGQLLDQFTPAECANYLANAGYAST